MTLTLPKMTQRSVQVLASVVFLGIAVGCYDLAGPKESGIRPARSGHGYADESSASDSIGSAALSSASLQNFPYDTWIEVVATGTITLHSKPGSILNYTGPVPVTGHADAPNRNPCVLELTIQIPRTWPSTYAFGPCGGYGFVDTVRALGPVSIKRGVMPLDYVGECSPVNADCHWVDPGYQYVSSTAIPLYLNPTTASPHAINFATSHPQVRFTGSIAPRTVYVGGVAQTMLMTATLWQWIGADSTRDYPTGASPCQYPNGPDWTRACLFVPQESGRMILKAYAGGKTLTDAVTVQCLVAPADSMLNDSTNDFKSREELQDLIPQSVAVSYHELTGVAWKLSNGGGFNFRRYFDPAATECETQLPFSEFSPSKAPEAGATAYSVYHDHTKAKDQILFGCNDTITVNGRPMLPARNPADVRPDSLNAIKVLSEAPSSFDLDYVRDSGKRMFIMTSSGWVWKIDPPVITGASPLQTVFRAFGGNTDSQRRCTWVKKYIP